MLEEQGSFYLCCFPDSLNLQKESWPVFDLLSGTAGFRKINKIMYGLFLAVDLPD